MRKVAYSISIMSGNLNYMRWFLSHIPTDQMLNVLFDMLESGKVYQIAMLISSWREKDFLGSKESWGDRPELLRLLAHKHRSVVMGCLATLVPLFAHLGHPSVVNEMFFSIHDVSRWWP